MSKADIATDLNWHSYGITPDDVVRQTLGCEPSDITPVAILAPTWKPEIFLDHQVEVEILHTGFVDIHRMHAAGFEFTMVRSGIGAPMTGDAMLALAAANCRHVLFIGAVGGLKTDQRVGDILIPTCSVSGDGFSTYIDDSPVETHPAFLQVVEPDPAWLETVDSYARIASANGEIACHRGAVYSIDTILAQFRLLDWMRQRFEVVGIDMETSCVFAVARRYGIRTAALLEFSDVSATRRSLISGRTDEDKERYRSVRRTIVASTALETVRTMIEQL
jgi:nucleoside phosphorylase